MRALPSLLSLTLLLALWVLPLSAQELALAWRYDPTVDAPDSFLVTYLSSVDPSQEHQFRVPNLGRPSCDALPDAAALPADAICGRTPDCLPPGIYSFWVQAEHGTEATDASNAANCEAFAGCRYDCTAVTMPPALQAALTYPKAGGAPTIDMEKAQQAVLPVVPSTPPVASVTTPPPTIQDVTDQVQAALDQLPKTPT